jgi:hypothetical protein
MKLDLSKAYIRKVGCISNCCFYVGFIVPFVKWLMGCLTLIYFVILINGSVFQVLHPLEGFDTRIPLSFVVHHNSKTFE